MLEGHSWTKFPKSSCNTPVYHTLLNWIWSFSYKTTEPASGRCAAGMSGLDSSAHGFAKLKVDGAVARSSNSGSFGAVCRDSNRLYMVFNHQQSWCFRSSNSQSFSLMWGTSSSEGFVSREYCDCIGLQRSCTRYQICFWWQACKYNQRDHHHCHWVPVLLFHLQRTGVKYRGT